MNPVYTKRAWLGLDSFDVYDRIFPSRYLTLAQDMAGEHADLLGCGYADLRPRDLMWIIVRTRLDILAQPTDKCEVILTTRVKKPAGLIFDREVEIRRADDGLLLATSISAWCVSNLETRRLVRPSEIAYPDTFEGPYIYADHLRAIPDFQPAGEPALVRRVNFTDLDHNRHMNNCRYADALLDAISPREDEHLTSLEINYEHECLEGDSLSIYLERPNEKGEGRARAVRGDGVLSFKARFTIT